MGEDEERFDLMVGVEAAWTGFRARLADHLAAMEEDDSLCIDAPTGVEEEELAGVAPSVQLVALEAELYAELAGNDSLDERYALDDAEEETLLGIGWEEPEEPGEELTALVERREVDRLAVMVVRALREVYDVPHPAFLSAEGLEVDPETRSPVPVPAVPEAPEEQSLEAAVFVHGPDELQEVVDRAVAAELGLDEVKHDDDGDIAIRAGATMVWVTVSRTWPAVRVWAAVAVGVQDLERLPVELGILNERHPFARFVAHDDRVELDHVLPAAPFSPPQLQTVLRQVLQDVESRGRDLIRRVGGRMLLEDAAEGSFSVPPSPETEPGLVALLEVMHVRSMTSAGVAELFDQDRGAIVRAIVGLRTGRIVTTEHDLDEVLDHLRRGLSHIAYREGRAQGRRPARRPGPRTQQLSLLSDGETLDDGQWEQGIS